MQASRRGALASTVNTVKRDIAEICQSGNFYVTEEIGNELNNISNGLDHLKLDDYLLATSKDWDKGFSPSQTQSHKASEYFFINYFVFSLSANIHVRSTLQLGQLYSH